MTDTGFAPHSSRTDWWSRRPRRSRSDSKVAGVAGGLGHHLGVDPILFRVGFVALTVVGGVGILAYTLLWLLLPAEGDEVSAGEALLGRGRSSVSPILAAVLVIAVLTSVAASFSWGMPFWPALVVVGVAFHVARRRRRGPFRPGSEWERRIRSAADDVASDRWSESGRSWSEPGRAGTEPGRGRPGRGAGWGACGGHGRPGTDHSPTADSPFDTPAFWDVPTDDPTVATPPADPFRKRGPADAVDEGAAERGGAQPAATPPAWDPLGAAPFAWDLPDIDVTPSGDRSPVRSRTTSPVIARVTVGIALLAVAVQVLGLIAGWWAPAWAVIAAVALTVVATGLLVQALRGRTLTLVGPGVLLSVATLVFSITGFAGTPHFGEIDAAPTSAAAVQPEYRLGAGDARLDLSGLVLAPNQRVVTSLDVGAGDATVVLPAGVAYTVTCSTNAGQIHCLDQQADGLDRTVGPVTATGGSAAIDLDVHVGAGNLTVTVAP